MFLPERYILRRFPFTVELAEVTVLITIGLPGSILLPQQLQADMPVCLHLPFQRCEINRGIAPRAPRRQAW